jgi:hypothetical protein
MLGLGCDVHGRPANLIRRLTRLARPMVNETLRPRCLFARSRSFFVRLFAPRSCFRQGTMVPRQGRSLQPMWCGASGTALESCFRNLSPGPAGCAVPFTLRPVGGRRIDIGHRPIRRS